jgi:secondary thiamine-phosphate synthase enzyme
MDSEVMSVDTGERLVTDITRRVEEFCSGRGDGLCSVFAQHATAGLALMEVGSGSEEDLADALARLLPRDASYVHSHGSRGHGADHLVPVLVSPSLVLPILGGAPALGTWQRVVLVDPNRDNPRRSVRLSFVAG